MASPTPSGFPNLPVIFDVSNSTMGTPDPNGSIIIQSSGFNGQSNSDYTVEVDTDSPIIERAEQGTITMKYNMSWMAAQYYVSIYSRGVILTDSHGNSARVLSCTAQRFRGNKGALTLIAESVTFDSPPDEFSCVPIEMGISIMKYPRYFNALLPNPATDSPLAQTVKSAIVRSIQTYQDSSYFPTASNVAGLNGSVHDLIVNTLKNGNLTYTVPNPNFVSVGVAGPILNVAATDAEILVGNPPYIVKAYTASNATGADFNSIALSLAAAQEIVSKLWRVEDSPYLAAFELTWSTYYFLPPYMSPGGYIENPITFGLPDYFYCPNRSVLEPVPRSTSEPPYDPTEATLFDLFRQYNPQCYSNNGTSGGQTLISSLRKADSVEFQRSWFKLTRSWIISAIGAWDSDLYSTGARPGCGSNTPPNGAPDYGFNVLPNL